MRTIEEIKTSIARIKEESRVVGLVLNKLTAGAGITAHSELIRNLVALTNQICQDHQDLVQIQEAEISRLRQQCEWQPIETAPKDKRIIIAHLPLDGIADIWFGYWSHQHSSWATTQWHTYPADWITHWMPIPPLPQAQEEKEDNHE